jgi:hypothetical protein
MSLPPFHLAFPVNDIESTRQFYSGLLGCEIGRESESWIDINFFGHQITAHAVGVEPPPTNPVDGKRVPVPHFGAILEWDAWHALADRLKAEEVDFLIGPYLRFEGQIGEQATLFVTDPSGNALEFKSFKDIRGAFAHEPWESRQ